MLRRQVHLINEHENLRWLIHHPLLRHISNHIEAKEFLMRMSESTNKTLKSLSGSRQTNKQ